MYINPPRAPSGDMATRIKFVNQVKPTETHAVTKQKAPRLPPASSAQAKPRRTTPDRPLEADEWPEEARQTYEACHRAFNELAAMHSAVQAESSDALRRLDRAEQELRRAREQSTGYAAQIAAQELEMRRVKEGKKAVEELNSRLNASLSAGKGGDPKLAAAHKAATEERDRLKAAHRAVTEERDRLKAAHDRAQESARDYDDMMEHVDRAIGICARACEQHAPDTAKDMRETQETLRAFRKSRQA